MRVARTLITVAMLGLLLGAAPVSAAPTYVTDTTFIPGVADPDHGLVLIWNTTRDDFCRWVQNGMPDPQPAITPITWFVNPTSAGPIKIRWSGTAHLELWTLDQALPAGPVDPCAATASSRAPWAIGTATVKNNDNDFFVTGNRTDSFGFVGVGSVRDGAGTAWNYQFHFRATISPDGAFRLVAPWQFVLQRSGA